MGKWTKRKLFTFQLEDRPRRALLWRKSLYAEWFEYAKLSQLMGGRIPRAFGDLQEFKNFEEWWRHPDYGFELFCEPVLLDTVTELTGRKSKAANTLNLTVRLDVDPDLVLRDFKNLLHKRAERIDYQSQARFKPSAAMQALKPDKLRHARIAFEVSEFATEGKTQLDVIFELSKMKAMIPKAKNSEIKKPEPERRRLQSPYHIAEYELPVFDEEGRLIKQTVASKPFEEWQKRKLRLLSYHRRMVKEAFKSIENGTFP